VRWSDAPRSLGQACWPGQQEGFGGNAANIFRITVRTKQQPFVTLRGALKALNDAALAATLEPIFARERAAADHAFVSERTAEYRYALDRLAGIAPKTILDVGSGPYAWPAILADVGWSVTALDEASGLRRGGFVNRHWPVKRDDITKPVTGGRFDAVTCISVLEHIPDHRAAMRGMFSFLPTGGFLILTCPYNETTFVEDAYQMPDAGYGRDAGYICRVYSRRELDGWLADNHGELVDEEFYRVFTGRLWTQGDRIGPAERSSKTSEHHLGCFTICKRG
jgi:SAM-dependent methyltransferase